MEQNHGTGRVILVLILLAVVFQGQDPPHKKWSWIIPGQTVRTQVEKTFGDSITEDKTHPFQTYLAEFGKITVTYNSTRRFVKFCSCVLDAGVVLKTFVSPKRFLLKDFNIDLTEFKKDATYAPRELSYFSESAGILIATEIVDLPDGKREERVVAIEYRPKKLK